MFDSVTPWTTARQASLSITSSQSLLRLLSIESVMPSNYLILFSSCLQCFPASRSFPMSQFFTSGGQNIGVSASASVLPVNIQDWFPLGLTGLISIFNCRLFIWLFDVNICSTDTFSKCTNTLLSLVRFIAQIIRINWILRGKKFL